MLAILSFAKVAALEVDTDGDGVTDSDEIAAGTDPLNSQSVPWRCIASWRFTAGTFTGDNGQQPIAQSNVNIATGFDGPGISLFPGGIVSLKYRAVEPSGKPNISATRGSILFRIKPTWSSGTGPGTWVTVLQTTNFAVKINPNGTAIHLISGTGANTITNAQVSIDVGNFGFYWSYGLVTYSPEQTTLSFDAPSTLVTGPGIAPPANFNDPNNFIAFGSAADGTGAINGYMDEIVVFDAPGSIGLSPVTISAVASNSPPGLNLVWASATNALTEVKKRTLGTATWSGTLAAFGTNYFDNSITPGQRYEYNINTRVLDLTTGLPDDVGVFVKGAVNGTPVHSQGKVILLVDQTLTNQIQAELGGFITNLVGDGWQVLRADVPRHIDDFSTTNAFLTNYFAMTNVIRPFVQSNYALFGPQIKYILIIGHVPVAYTGTIADDGHNDPNQFHGSHSGAWASDLFYGDVDGVWTDVITSTSSSFIFNQNYPGDGRLDQNKIPANDSGDTTLEIPVARIDFSFLPSFTADSEADLLKKYLRKDADYRNGLRPFSADTMAAEYLATTSTATYDLAKQFESKIKALGQAKTGNVFQDTASYVFGIQSGPGYFDRLNDALPNVQLTTANVAAGQLSTNCAFYFVRGSYFPDWNTQDNIMRALLTTTNGGLAAGAYLSALPGWRVNGLGVGYGLGSEMADVASTWSVIGVSVRAMELLGDATLRYPVQPPPASLSWTVTNNAVTLRWPSAGGASGYYVYRSTNGALGTFSQLTATPLAKTNYTDVGVPSGSIVYMVRSAGLAVTGGGSYTNLSQGIFSRTITSADSTTCCVAPQTIPEDGALQPVQFSLGEAASESGLTISAVSSSTALVPNNAIVLGGSGPSRTVAATPVANQFGATTITVTIQTDLSTIVRAFTLTVQPVNDPPSFTKGPDVAVAQGSGAQTVASWATTISPGPANESAQTVSFVVTNDSPFLFTVPPAIAADGTLSFTSDSFQRGTAHVTVQAKDSGGTANGGNDTSAAQVFNLVVGLPLDTDGDGLPDDFEQVYGFDPNSATDATQDWDGDGMSNLQEFAAGTNPKDSRSSVHINSAASQSPTFAITFNSVAGKVYSLQANDSFADSGSWQTLTNNIAGTGSPIQQLDTGASNSSRRIYRVVSSANGGGQILSEPVGLCRLTLPGSSDTLLSIPFLRPAGDLGAVVAVSNNTVQVQGPANWLAGQWAYASGSQSNTYFMLIRSGAVAGDYYTVTGNTSNTLTLDLEGGTLTGLQPGDSIALIPYWTLGTLFHGGAGVNPSPSPGNRQTELLFPSLGSTGINLSAGATYYFWNGAWRQVGQGATIKNDDVIVPDMYLIVRQNVNTNTTVTTEGAVLTGRLRSLVRRNPGSQQDNLLALPRPLNVSLIDSGLISSGAFRASPSPGGRIDELLVFDNSVIGQNKSAAGTYYYWNGAWRKVGFGATDHGADAVFAPGVGVIIRSGSGTTNAIWANDPTY